VVDCGGKVLPVPAEKKNSLRKISLNGGRTQTKRLHHACKTHTRRQFSEEPLVVVDCSALIHGGSGSQPAPRGGTIRAGHRSDLKWRRQQPLNETDRGASVRE
jgi:hypothetical protein